MDKLTIFLILYFIVIILITLFCRWLFKKPKHITTRYICDDLKERIWERYYERCAVCDENRLSDIHWHHRIRYAKGGETTEDNLVPLCSYHHNLITRYPKN